MTGRRLTAAAGVIAVPVLGIAVGVHLAGVVLMTAAYLIVVSSI